MSDSIYSEIQHGMIMLAIFLLTINVLKLLFEKVDPVVRQLRGLAFGLGLLIFIGAKTSGMDIPNLVLNSLNIGGLLNTEFVHNLTATMIGAFMASLLVFMAKRSREVSKVVYLIIMTITFIILTFTDMYITSQFVDDGGDKNILKMNLFFVIGLGLSLLFMNISKMTKGGNDEPEEDNWRNKI